MVSIEQRFEKIREENPNLGDYIVMCMTVKAMGYKPSTIKSAFKKLVSDEEYAKDEKEELLEYLYLKTKDEIKT